MSVQIGATLYWTSENDAGAETPTTRTLRNSITPGTRLPNQHLEYLREAPTMYKAQVQQT